MRELARRINHDKKPKPAVKARRYRFFEQGKEKGKIEGRDIVLLRGEKEKKTYDEFCNSVRNQFIGVEYHGKKEEKCAFQNRILRAKENKIIQVDLDKFEYDVKTKANWDNQAQMQFSNVIAGIKSALDALDATRRKCPEKLKQDVGTNDYLDAYSAIDLIDVRYFQNEDGTQELLLIQAKSKYKEKMTETEIDDIQTKHQLFVRRLLTTEQAHYVEQKDETKKELDLEKGGYFERMKLERMKKEAENEGKARSVVLFDYFGDFFYKLFDPEMEMDNEKINALVVAQNKPIAPYKLFFTLNGSHKLIAEIVHAEFGVDISKDNGLRKLETFKNWANLNPPTRDELDEIIPDWKPSKQFFTATKFVSIIYLSDKVIVKPIILGDAGGKHLTIINKAA